MPSIYPAHGDLMIYQGDHYAGIVTVLTDDGTPADITGYTALSQIRANVADQADVTVELATSVQSPTVILSLTNFETAELCGGRYMWDLELTSPEGTVVTVMSGRAVVSAEITREEVTTWSTVAALRR